MRQTIKNRKTTLSHTKIVSEMPSYSRQIWDNVPHFIASDLPDANGYYYILYPDSFGGFMDDVDIEFCKRAGCKVEGIKTQILWDEEYMPISRCLTIIKTKDIEAAKQAVFEIHSLMYMVNIWFMYMPWLNMYDGYTSMIQGPNNFVERLFDNPDFQFMDKQSIDNMLAAERENEMKFATDFTYGEFSALRKKEGSV